MEWRTAVITVFIVSLCFLAIPIRIEPETVEHDVKLFEAYVEQYKKPYRHKPSEYDQRFERFQRSLRHIEKMNQLRTSEESAIYGLTNFSDMSEEEFLTVTLRPDLSSRSQRHRNHSHHHEHRHRHDNRVKRAAGIPLKVDWRTKGVVTPVRSQKKCGACWAFSTIEVAESMYAIKNGTLYSLSVQEMIDCAGYSNFGCEGGDICSLLMWLSGMKVGIQLDSTYPLTWTTDTCKMAPKTTKPAGIRVKDYTCDSFVDAEDELLATLANHGPVAAAVNALSWQNYLSGVIQFHCDGAFVNLNHAVQIVGYDNTGPTPFYIVRNSWGPLFGDNGYLYIAIGSNLCGIANQVSSLNVI